MLMRAAGKTRAEIAEQLGMSTRTVSRLWKPAA
jgi:DNA-binding CsgD family transcriptional regulator